jgi:DNA polymerase (family 10)
MPWLNEEVSGLLREYAELIQITGGDVFRARNYEKAARSVRGSGEDISQLDVKGLRAIPGVGASIAAKIAEYLATGHIAALDELRAKIPAGVLELTRVPGLGPKRALQLNHDLGISSVDELAAAVQAGRLEGLAGFGARSEERLASGIEVYRQGRERVLLDVALHTATTAMAALSAVPGCQRCAYAGSLRRWRETIGDVDILAAADDSAPLMAAFAAGPEVASVIASGPTKTSIRTSAGLQVDLRVVQLDAWGAALQYFTGSQAHNVAVRQVAIRQKLKLSEYGLFDVGTGDLIVSRTEEEVYARLGLTWIPPAMREDHGEVEAAARGEIPRLVQINDLKGDLHTHTDLTDGVASLEDMVAAAARRGYEYYAITDHAPNLFFQRMTDEKMLAQRDRVRALEAPLDLLHGHRAQHRGGRVGGLGRRFPGRVRPVRGLGALQLRPAARRDDPALRHRVRESAGQHHRPPPGPADRAAAAGRRGLRRAVPGLRPDRDRAGDQRLPAAARPAVRPHPRGPRRRRGVRHRQRRALGRRPGQHAVRRRHRAARLAHRRRRDQHLAPGPAPRLPAQGPTVELRGGARR